MRRIIFSVTVLTLLGACDRVSDPDASLDASGETPTEVLFRGTYTYRADAGLFTECGTGITRPVAMEADAVALEIAYLGLREEVGEPLLVLVRGYIAPRPGMEGGTEDALIVTAFQSVFMGEGCAQEVTGPPLEGTEWIALELHGGSVPMLEPPSLSVDSEAGLVAWTACAGLTGTYTLRGGELRFSPNAPPDVPCEPIPSRFQQSFLQVLRATGSYELSGDTLKLMGESGVIARFLAEGS
jgi:copper homeostasis protein (lipoprotein)